MRLEALPFQGQYHLQGEFSGYIGSKGIKFGARFKNGVFWVPVGEPVPTGKRQLIEGVE